MVSASTCRVASLLSLWAISSLVVIGCNANQNASSPSSDSSADSRSGGSSNSAKTSGANETVAYVHNLASDSVASVYGPVPERPAPRRQKNNSNMSDTDTNDMSDTLSDESTPGPSDEPDMTETMDTVDGTDMTETTDMLDTTDMVDENGMLTEGDASVDDGVTDTTTAPDGMGNLLTDTTGDDSIRGGQGPDKKSPGKRGAVKNGGADASGLIVRLTTAVALEQTTVDGTKMSFSVDYIQIGGTPKQGARYFWVISRERGDKSAIPIESLESRGTLTTLKNWRKSQGPFTSRIMSLLPDRTRRPVSESVTHN